MTRDWRAERQIVQPISLLSVFSIGLALTIGTAAATLSLSENFDAITPPALPAGWVADQGTNAGGFPLWQTSNSGDPTPIADSQPNSAFTPDPNNVLDNRLYSPTFTYTASSRLSFRQNFDLEESTSTIAYDCGVFEININNSGWTDILQAGGSFETGGYNHTTVQSGFENPLPSNRSNWSGNSGGFLTTIVVLPASGAGQPVQLRWRMASDNSVSRLGWRIDSVMILPSTCPAGFNTWRIAAVGDFNPSTWPDYLLYDSASRRTAVWYLNGNTYVGSASGRTITAGWQIAGAGDFNGDGNLDYALFNPTTRQTAIWYLSGVTFVSSGYGPMLPAGWALTAIGDFNGDGKPDFVLYKANTRQTAIWYMNNRNYLGSSNGPSIAAGWRLAGIADFNRDTKPDYLLFNTATLRSAIWYLSGATYINGAYGPSLPSGWEIVRVADFNADTKPDYVIYKAGTRQTAIWYLNNNVYAGSAYGPTLPCD